MYLFIFGSCCFVEDGGYGCCYIISFFATGLRSHFLSVPFLPSLLLEAPLLLSFSFLSFPFVSIQSFWPPCLCRVVPCSSMPLEQA